MPSKRLQGGGGLVVGRARVDRRPACRARRPARAARSKSSCWRSCGRVVAVEVEAGLADGDRALVARAARAARRAGSRRRSAAWCGWIPSAAKTPSCAAGDRERLPGTSRARCRPRRSGRRRLRVPARRARPPARAHASRCAWVSITPRRSAASTRGKSGAAASIPSVSGVQAVGDPLEPEVDRLAERLEDPRRGLAAGTARARPRPRAARRPGRRAPRRARRPGPRPWRAARARSARRGGSAGARAPRSSSSAPVMSRRRSARTSVPRELVERGAAARRSAVRARTRPSR